MKQFILKELQTDLVTHERTTWQLSDSVTFDNIIDSVSNSTLYRNTWFVDVSLLAGTTLYIRARRIFDDDSVSDWVMFSEVMSGVSDINFVMNESEVSSPMLMGAVSIERTEDLIEFHLAPMRSNGLQHLSTDFIISKLNGDIVFKKLNDRTNKTYLYLDTENYDMSIYETLKLYVCYKNENGVRSEFAEFTIDPVEVKVYPTYKPEYITPALSYDLALVNQDNVEYDLYIYDNESKEDKFAVFKTTALNIRIPKYTLSYNKTYLLKIIDSATDMVYCQEEFTTKNSKDSYNLINNVNEIKFDTIPWVFPFDTETVDKSKEYYIEGVDDNFAIFYDPDKKWFVISKITRDAPGIIYSYKELEREIAKDKINILRIHNDRIVVIANDTDGNITIHQVSYNILHYSAVSDTGVYNTDFSLTDKIGINASVFNGLRRKLYLLAENTGNNKVYMLIYDLETSTYSIGPELLEQEYHHYTLSQVDNDRLLITAAGLYNGDEATVWVYNIRTNVFDNIQSVPTELKDDNLLTVKLRDGNIMLLNSTPGGQNTKYGLFDIEGLTLDVVDTDSYKIGNVALTNLNGTMFIDIDDEADKVNYLRQQ